MKNYKALIGLCLFLIICLIIFANLWEIIAAKTGAFHLDPSQLLWYIALNEWVLIAIPRPEREIEVDLRSGKLAYSLPKPISYLWVNFWESAGVLAVNLVVLGIAAGSFTWFYIGGFPAPLWVLPFLFLTGVIAGVVGVFLQMLIGLTAFWIHEVEPIAWLFEKLLFALGGLILPLSVYPNIWQQIAKFTPFPYILGYRSSLVMDPSPHFLVTILGALIIWGFIGVILLNVFYRKGLEILNAEGG